MTEWYDSACYWDEDEIRGRAYQAMRRYCRRHGYAWMEPTEPEWIEHEGKTYLIFYNTYGILAAYRVGDDGRIFRVRNLEKMEDLLA